MSDDWIWTRGFTVEKRLWLMLLNSPVDLSLSFWCWLNDIKIPWALWLWNEASEECSNRGSWRAGGWAPLQQKQKAHGPCLSPCIKWLPSSESSPPNSVWLLENPRQDSVPLASLYTWRARMSVRVHTPWRLSEGQRTAFRTWFFSPVMGSRDWTEACMARTFAC